MKITHKLVFNHYHMNEALCRYEFTDRTNQVWFWKKVTCKNCLKKRKATK